MQIRINLDQIFGAGSDPNQNESQSLFQSYHVSDKVSQSVSNNRYKINIPVFDEEPVKQETTPKATRQSPKSKSPSIVSIQTQFSDKAPGERLYYQSKNTMSRKALELERLKLEKLKQEEKQTTFRPKINKNSQKILVKKGKQPVYEKKEPIKATPTYIRKEQQQIMQCTFKPELIAKTTPRLAKTRQKNQIFQQLFNDHKLKQVKQKLKTQENQKQAKKLTKAEFENFIARSNEFMSKVEKKKQIILTTSSRFDLDTGHKMFSPKTNTFKSHKNYFSKQSQSKQPSVQAPNKIVTKSIFNKNYQELEQQESSSSLFNQYRRGQNKLNDSPTEKGFNCFEQIEEVRHDDQQEEQIGREQQIFKTVKCFDVNQDKQQFQDNDYQGHVNNDYQYQDLPVEQEPHPFFGDLDHEKSDEGQTNHEGQESRCHERQ